MIDHTNHHPTVLTNQFKGRRRGGTYIMRNSSSNKDNISSSSSSSSLVHRLLGPCAYSSSERKTRSRRHREEETAAMDLDAQVAVAVDKDKNSQCALKWALENLLIKGQTVHLIHVVKGHQDGTSTNHAKELLHPFRCFCTRKNVQANDVILEDGDTAKAIIDFASQNSIDKLVIGAPSKTGLLRLRMSDISTSVSKGAPDFCSVYVINKGKLSSLRNAIRAAPYASRPRALIQSQTSIKSDKDQLCFVSSPRGNALPDNHSSHSNGGDRTPSRSPFGRAVGGQGLPAEANANAFLSSGRPSIDRLFPRGSAKPQGELSLSGSDISFVSLGRPSVDCGFTNRRSNADSFEHSFERYSNDGHSASSFSQEGSSLQSLSMDEWETEMARLRQELKQTMDMYSNACKEALSAKQKAIELHQWKIQEEQKLEEARLAEETARAMVEKEKAKSKAALEAAEASRRIAELEAQKRLNAEMKAAKEAEEKKKALDALAKNNNNVRYRKYSVEELEAATADFTDEFKIGEGGYGPVYKGRLDHTPVAIKVLRAGGDAAQGKLQFQQEVEILSCIRHPNMVLLLGACPENGCLVYEYMANGSLEDRLFQRGSTPPIPWQQRFRIAAEIGTALLFLHQTKPEPLVHRDLKPANILLDGNYVSKISDVGLARLVPPSVANTVTQYHMTSTAGTFCYIDPEYQQTGMLGIKSDVYSLGILLLQVITAKPPMGLTHHVERAIEKGTFGEMLDPAVPDWPYEDALSLANMALKCAELRRKDRPDLGTAVLPELNRLRDMARESMRCMPGGSGIHGSPMQSQVSMQGLLSGPVHEQSVYDSRTSTSSIRLQED